MSSGRGAEKGFMDEAPRGSPIVSVRLCSWAYNEAWPAASTTSLSSPRLFLLHSSPMLIPGRLRPLPFILLRPTTTPSTHPFLNSFPVLKFISPSTDALPTPLPAGCIPRPRTSNPHRPRPASSSTPRHYRTRYASSTPHVHTHTYAPAFDDGERRRRVFAAPLAPDAADPRTQTTSALSPRLSPSTRRAKGAREVPTPGGGA
ncbi:hypothetical protein B0H17DRAFT_1217415 [Mycena rosella]|uniref:Uncharacterized protein n=1 Tax=Mycena rosella TaxID=1033263 RepID=A0AAD7BYA9_MYCRO|nr:hypothetical protein B0H17DRAFT_1217415 [Mycena rosella]